MNISVGEGTPLPTLGRYASVHLAHFLIRQKVSESCSGCGIASRYFTFRLVPGVAIEGLDLFDD